MFKYAALSALSIDFYPEISALITEDNFKALYNHSVTSRHDFLVVDLSAPPDRVWRKSQLIEALQASLFLQINVRFLVSSDSSEFCEPIY